MQSAAAITDDRPDYSPRSSRTTALSKNYDHHVLFTRFLERIISGKANGCTLKERAMAEEWGRIQDEQWAALWDRIWKVKAPRKRVKAVGA